MGCTSSAKGIKKELFTYFQKNVRSKLFAYEFDSHVGDSFANRVAKENSVPLKTAKLWIKFYKFYIVYVGWLFHVGESKIKKPDADMNKYLILPFEICQVWREHILYTEKYSELCKIVTCDQLDFIPFVPVKSVWKKYKIDTLKNNLKKNRNMLTILLNSYKNEIDALFNIQACYLKNSINFYCRESDITYRLIQTKYEEEMNNSKGVMIHNMRTLGALVEMTDRLVELIRSLIKKEEYLGRRDWTLERNINNIARAKVESFQNIFFPSNFLQNFCEDHLMSYARGEIYLNEYKKFLFLSYVTEQPQSPSEEVDLVWHYHQNHINDYLQFSNLKMEKRVFIHSPNNGTQENKVTLPNTYNKTREFLQFYFGYINDDVWSERHENSTEQSKWFNHHSILLKGTLKGASFCKPSNLKPYCNLTAGCVMGCGTVYGGPDTVGCGNWKEDNTIDNSGVVANCTVNSWCCGNCVSGCSAATKGQTGNLSNSSDGCFGC
jgi:hypothetical protein